MSPLGIRVMRNCVTGGLPFRYMQPVIPSASRCHSERNEESHKDVLGMPCEILHSAPLRSERHGRGLRSVRNDMVEGCALFGMTWPRAALRSERHGRGLRSVRNDMAEGGLSGNMIHSNVDTT